MWVTKLLIFPVEIRIFCPKTTKFCPKYAFMGTYRHCRFIWCPVGWWLWRAGCILQDTYLLYRHRGCFGKYNPCPLALTSDGHFSAMMVTTRKLFACKMQNTQNAKPNLITLLQLAICRHFYVLPSWSD